MTKMHRTDDKSDLITAQGIVDYINMVLLGEEDLFWESECLPKRKYSEKIVGEDFQKKVLESKNDVAVFVAHPLKRKNRKLAEVWEHVAR